MIQIQKGVKVDMPIYPNWKIFNLECNSLNFARVYISSKRNELTSY